MFIAIRYRNTYGVIPGGLIVPGSLIVLLTISPLWFITVIGLSGIVYALYQRWFRRTDYKRRTPMYVLACLSLVLSSLVALLYNHWGWLEFSLDVQVGSILPGVIAFNLSKQDFKRVSQAIALCTSLTLAGIIGILGLLDILGIPHIHQLVSTGNPVMTLNYPLVHFVLALGVGYLIYRYQDIRSGGYMVAPIVALAMFDPLTAFHFVIGCVLVYHITQRFCERTLTVGLNRYVVVLCLSTLYLWGTELWIQSMMPGIVIAHGSSYLLNIAMLSCVNDAILYHSKSVLKYMTLLVGTSMVGILALS
ncbi:MAG: poly-gamma-glutamate biosynthesis protein PgsC/CapC [Cyanobacteria bacterium P01_F01_bin.150]